MTGKGQYRRFKFAFLLVGLISCATPKLPVNQEGSPGNALDRAKLAPIDIQAELSSHDLAAGTIGLVSIHLPDNLRHKKISAEFDGNEFPFFKSSSPDPGEFQAILPVPYDRKPGPGVVTIYIGEGADEKKAQVSLQVVEGNYSSEVLHVSAGKVNPTKKKVLARIIKEQAEVAEIYKKVTPTKFWAGPFAYPINSKVTSAFGTKRLYNGKLKNFHPGLDLKAPMRTPIYAPAPGVVVLAKNLFYTGNTVILDHGYGLITLYAHMNQIQVKTGQAVQAKDLLGLSGNTGRVNGPHLHWQAVVHRVKINPVGLVQVIR